MNGLLQFLLGVLVGAVGVALTPWVKHIVPQPGRRRAALTTIERAVADQQVWLERSNAEMAKELQAVDEDAAARGIFNSSIRLQERQDVEARYRREQAEGLRGVLRVAHDATQTLGQFERRSLKRWLEGKGKGPPDSVEAQVFGKAGM